MIDIRKEVASNNTNIIIGYILDNKADTLKVNRIFHSLKLYPNGINILNSIMPNIVDKIDNNIVFNAIYNISELEQYTIYLIFKKRRHLENISQTQMLYFLNRSTMWQDFIIKNIKSILKDNKEAKLKSLFFMMLTKEDIENKLTNVLSGSILRDYTKYLLVSDTKKANQYISKNINKLIYEHIEDNTLITLDNTSPKNNKLISIIELEKLLDNLLKSNASDQNIRTIANVIVNNFINNNVASIMHDRAYHNFNTFLSKNLGLIIDNVRDTRIIHYAKNNSILDSTLEDRYSLILQLMADGNHNENKNIYAITDAIMNNNLDTYVSNIFYKFSNSSNYDLNQIGKGATSTVYKIDDYVVKLGTKRFSFACPKHYRIAPSYIRKQITNEQGEPVFYVEVQKFYSSDGLNQELMYQVLKDLYEDGIEVTDPLTLSLYYSNFAFLDDISKMNTTTNEENEDKGYIYLDKDITPSANFKKNPLVIIDTDLMYPINQENKKYFTSSNSPLITHQKALERYEKTKIKTLR